jgi:hypothetical protein
MRADFQVKVGRAAVDRNFEQVVDQHGFTPEPLGYAR